MARGRTKAREALVDDATSQLRFVERVGAALRAHRLARGLTQAALAEQAKLTANFLARVERGELGLSLYVADRLARVLGCELPALVEEVKKQAPGVLRKKAR